MGLALFVSIFLIVYAGFHLVVWWRLRPLLPDGRRSRRLLALLALIMILVPVTDAVLSRVLGWREVGDVLGWIGYVWMGLLMVAMPVALISLVLEWAGRRLSPRAPGPRWWAGAALATILVLTPLAAWEAVGLRVVRVELTSAKLPAGMDELRIVQISDVHLGAQEGAYLLDKVADLVRPLKPHLIVSTGDLVDMPFPDEDRLAAILAGLEAPLGKYACTGNHEFYSGIPRATAFHAKAGFELLRNTSRVAGGVVNLAAVDDPGRNGPVADDAAALAGLDPNRYTILLKHRPRVQEAAQGRWDLQLSGHTHRGQIIFYRPMVAALYPYLAGRFDLEGGGVLYTSPGTGTWGPPMRLGAQPEVTLFVVRRAG